MLLLAYEVNPFRLEGYCHTLFFAVIDTVTSL